MFMVCSTGDLVTDILFLTQFVHVLFRGVGYVCSTPTPKNSLAVLYTIACLKILSNFELFFKRGAAPLTKWGRKYL